MGARHLRDDGELIQWSRGDIEAPPAAAQVGGQAGDEAEICRVVDGNEYPWTNSHHIAGDPARVCRSSRTPHRPACFLAAVPRRSARSVGSDR